MPAGARRWYRSLYWRIATGFVAFLAVMLMAQGGLFLWLSTQRDEAMPPRLLADLTRLVADQLADFGCQPRTPIVIPFSDVFVPKSVQPKLKRENRWRGSFDPCPCRGVVNLIQATEPKIALVQQEI